MELGTISSQKDDWERYIVGKAGMAGADCNLMESTALDLLIRIRKQLGMTDREDGLYRLGRGHERNCRRKVEKRDG